MGHILLPAFPYSESSWFSISGASAILKWPFLVNTSPQKCNICVPYHFLHYVCGLWLLLEFPWLLGKEVGYNSWQHSSLSITLKSSSYFKTFFWDHYKNKKTNGRVISSHEQLPSRYLKKNTKNSHRKQ